MISSSNHKLEDNIPWGYTETATAVQQGGHTTLASPFVATTPSKLHPLTVSNASKQALTERSIALQATEHYYGSVPVRTSDMCGTYIVKIDGRRKNGERLLGYASFVVK